MDYSKFSDDTLKQIASGKPLDYSKLTDDELREIAPAPATAKEVPAALKATKASQKQYSPLESAGKGIQQGALLGGADELAGAAQAIPNALMSLGHNVAPSLVGMSPTQMNEYLKSQGTKGDIGPTSSKELYKEVQKEEQGEQKAAEEQNPISYIGGNLAGGLLGFSGAKALGAIPELAKGAEGTDALARASRIGATAVNAAPIGATAGALSSNANLVGGNADDLKELAKDTATGAATGSLVGAGIQAGAEALGAGAQAAGKAFGKYAPKDLKHMLYNYKLGTQGVNPGSEATRVGTLANPESLEAPLSQQTTDTAMSLVDKYKQGKEILGQKLGQVLQDATDNGQTLKLTPEFNKSLNAFEQVADQNNLLQENPQFSKLYEQITALKNNELNPIEARQLKDSVSAIAEQSFGQGIAGNQIAVLAKGFAEDLNSALKSQVSGFGQANDAFSQFLIPFEASLSKGLPAEGSGVSISRMKNSPAKIADRLKYIMQNLGDNGKADSTYSQFLRSLQKAQQNATKAGTQSIAEGSPAAQPSIFDQLGMQPQDIEKTLKDANFKYKAQQAYGAANGTSPVTNPIKFLTGNANIVANKLGLGVGSNAAQAAAGQLSKVAESVSPVALAGIESTAAQNETGKLSDVRGDNQVLHASQKLYAATDDELSHFGQQLAKIPGQQPLATSLQKAIQDHDTHSKNAILFSIMQNPSLRSIVDSESLPQL